MGHSVRLDSDGQSYQTMSKIHVPDLWPLLRSFEMLARYGLQYEWRYSNLYHSQLTGGLLLPDGWPLRPNSVLMYDAPSELNSHTSFAPRWIYIPHRENTARATCHLVGLGVWVIYILILWHISLKLVSQAPLSWGPWMPHLTSPDLTPTHRTPTHDRTLKMGHQLLMTC